VASVGEKKITRLGKKGGGGTAKPNTEKESNTRTKGKVAGAWPEGGRKKGNQSTDCAEFRRNQPH